MEEIAMANAATSGTPTEQGKSPLAARVGGNAVPAASCRLDLNAALALGQKRAALAAFGGGHDHDREGVYRRGRKAKSRSQLCSFFGDPDIKTGLWQS